MSFRISQYGITLKRLTKDNIEIVRQGRNLAHVRKSMEYKKVISPAQQEKWFASINNKLNYYFLIEYQGQDIGVINCKDVNEKDQLGEGGVFIYDKKYLTSVIPAFASVVLLDFIFNEIQFGNFSVVRIMRDNKIAINYNKSLGYVILPNQHKLKNQYYVLTKETFNTKAKKLRIAIKNYTQTDGKMEVVGKPSPLNIEKINSYLRKK